VPEVLVGGEFHSREGAHPEARRRSYQLSLIGLLHIRSINQNKKNRSVVKTISAATEELMEPVALPRPRTFCSRAVRTGTKVSRLESTSQVTFLRSPSSLFGAVHPWRTRYLSLRHCGNIYTKMTQQHPWSYQRAGNHDGEDPSRCIKNARTQTLWFGLQTETATDALAFQKIT
jgi:hypothetical protein